MFTKISGLILIVVLALSLTMTTTGLSEIWENPLPDLVKESRENMIALFTELKEKYDFPFEALEFLSPEILNNYISGLNPNDKEQISKAAELADAMNTHIKALYFYHEGEQYLRRLETLGWIIHYNDRKVFNAIYQEFQEKWDTLTRLDFDDRGNEVLMPWQINMTFDKICIFNGEFEHPNPLVSAVLFDNPEIKSEFPEKGIVLYLRGEQPGPAPMNKAYTIEFRWFDEAGNKHIVWDRHMPYPLPIFLTVENALY